MVQVRLYGGQIGYQRQWGSQKRLQSQVEMRISGSAHEKKNLLLTDLRLGISYRITR
jgi:hypothetical protein